MKKFTEYITENVAEKKCHLRNLYIQIDEELRKLIKTEHSENRKDQKHNITEDINFNEVKDIVDKCDDLIVNKLLNNAIEINTGKEQFGIRKLTKQFNYVSFACIFEVVYFNKETFEYDLNIVTHDKVNYIFKFNENTKFAFEIDKSNRVREIQI